MLNPERQRNAMVITEEDSSKGRVPTLQMPDKKPPHSDHAPRRAELEYGFKRGTGGINEKALPEFSSNTPYAHEVVLRRGV